MAFKNTTIILVFSVALNVFIGSLLAYVLGRYQFRDRALIFLLIMGARVIPTITTQVATFSVIQKLGLFNSLGAPIILYAGTDVVQTYLYLQFVNSIPRALDESARIDGASPFRTYCSIIFLLLKPETVTVMILKIVAIYNDMYIPYLYLTKNSNSVISTALLKFCGSPYGAQVPLVSAAFVIAVVPMLLLYLFSQRFLFDGITAGAVKG